MSQIFTIKRFSTLKIGKSSMIALMGGLMSVFISLPSFATKPARELPKSSAPSEADLTDSISSLHLLSTQLFSSIKEYDGEGSKLNGTAASTETKRTLLLDMASDLRGRLQDAKEKVAASLEEERKAGTTNVGLSKLNDARMRLVVLVSHCQTIFSAVENRFGKESIPAKPSHSWVKAFAATEAQQLRVYPRQNFPPTRLSALPQPRSSKLPSAEKLMGLGVAASTLAGLVYAHFAYQKEAANTNPDIKVVRPGRTGNK